MLDAHALASARIVETGDVAGGVNAVSRAQPRINNDAPRVVQLDAFDEMSDWANPRPDDDHIRLNAFAVVERHCFHIVTALEAIDDRAKLKAYTVTLVQTPEYRTHFRAEYCLERLLRRSDYRHFEPTLAQTVSRLHRYKARTDDDGPS